MSTKVMRVGMILADLAIAAAVTVAALSALPAGAHHSTAAFDNSRVVKLEGTAEAIECVR